MKVKICGLKQPEDVQCCLEAGVEMIGLNFFPSSPRSIDLDQAELLCAIAGDACETVGLFVDASPEMIEHYSKVLKLSAVQLYQKEALPRSVARWFYAFRVRDAADLTQVVEEVERCAVRPDYILLDGFSATQWGGAGVTAPWQLLDRAPRPLMLAGGLQAENIVQAIEIVRPDAVDVASGVERSPGIKDHTKIELFVRRVREAGLISS